MYVFIIKDNEQREVYISAKKAMNKVEKIVIE